MFDINPFAARHRQLEQREGLEMLKLAMPDDDLAGCPGCRFYWTCPVPHRQERTETGPRVDTTLSDLNLHLIDLADLGAAGTPVAMNDLGDPAGESGPAGGEVPSRDAARGAASAVAGLSFADLDFDDIEYDDPE